MAALLRRQKEEIAFAAEMAEAEFRCKLVREEQSRQVQQQYLLVNAQDKRDAEWEALRQDHAQRSAAASAFPASYVPRMRMCMC